MSVVALLLYASVEVRKRVTAALLLGVVAYTSSIIIIAPPVIGDAARRRRQRRSLLLLLCRSKAPQEALKLRNSIFERVVASSIALRVRM